MYQTGNTIQKTLDEILSHKLVLPAIQREFVWKPEQICRLFDSLMQGYPFGTFLYWQVESENSGDFKFYGFVLNYHQRDYPHCPPLPEMPNQPLTAVLDGQQRLTALNIGLRGSMAWKLPRKRWNNPAAFPIRKLYLDLLWQSGEDEGEGLKYRFSFLTDKEAATARPQACWFPVGDILKMENGGPALTQWLNSRITSPEQMVPTHTTLYQLYEVVHTKHLVAFYEERSQDLEKVLQIFIRTNSGGTILTYSDLLLSVAVAQWTHYDAREEIHALVDDLNKIGNGFSFPKDLVLKAGLMLSDIGSVGFKVENFNRKNMAVLENKWDGIKKALTLAVQLVSDFGFNSQNLSANNAVLPIAYYLYIRNPSAYMTSNQFRQDRQKIREWLIQSLLKGVWGGSSDALLTALRQVIQANGCHNDFPVARIREVLTLRGRSLVFEDEEIEELADMQYSNGLTFALLSMLFPFVDLRNQFHIDHIFPKSRFNRRLLRDAGISDDKIDDSIQRKDMLANLQLLQGAENIEKSAKMPAEWLCQQFFAPTDRQAYKDRHLLGEVPKEMAEFDSFYDARRERLKENIRQLLGR